MPPDGSRKVAVNAAITGGGTRGIGATPRGKERMSEYGRRVRPVQKLWGGGAGTGLKKAHRLHAGKRFGGISWVAGK